MRLLPRDIGIDGRNKPGLAELAEHHTHETRSKQWGGPQRDERFPAGLAEALLGGEGNPLREHRERAARLLVLCEGLPLALEHRERGRMEWVTRLEPAPQELPCLRLRRGGIDGCPFGWELSPPLEAPVGEAFRHVLPDALAPQVLEQPAPDHLADFGLVVGNEILGDPPDDLRDPVLPLEVPVSHLDLAAWETDDGGPVGRASSGDSKILEERVERVGHLAMAIHEVEDLVEQQQHRRAGRLEDTGDGLGARRGRLRSLAQGLDALVARQLPGDVDPGCLPSVLWVPCVAYEHRYPSPGNG